MDILNGLNLQQHHAVSAPDGPALILAGPSGVVSHTFGLSGTFPVTLDVANLCGLAAPMVRQVSVTRTPDGPYKIFLPLVLKKS